MNSRTFARCALIVPLLALPACSSLRTMFSSGFGLGSEAGLSDVDDLLDSVERVHVESVLSQERLMDALVALQSVVTPDFEGDALTTFALFADAVDGSEAQAEQLREVIEPMKDTADEVFESWEDEMGEFTSERMRKHSEERLAETRDRYDAIVEAADPAIATYDRINGVLRDLVLFLEYDFNAAAVAEVEREVQEMMAMAVELDEHLQAIQAAAREYVGAAALRGQDSLSRTARAEIEVAEPAEAPSEPRPANGKAKAKNNKAKKSAESSK